MPAESTVGNMTSYASAGAAVGGPVGAVVGGVIGLASSIFGSSSKAEEAARLIKKLQQQQRVIAKGIGEAGTAYQSATLIAKDQFSRGTQEISKELQDTAFSTLGGYNTATAASGFEKVGEGERLFGKQTSSIEFAEKLGKENLEESLNQSLAAAYSQMSGTQTEGMGALAEIGTEIKKQQGQDTFWENFWG